MFQVFPSPQKQVPIGRCLENNQKGMYLIACVKRKKELKQPHQLRHLKVILFHLFVEFSMNVQ